MERSNRLSLKTLLFDSSAIQRLTAMMIVIFIAFQTVSALSVGEKTALQQILNNFQVLSSVAPWETVDEFGNYYGRSWNASFEDLCLIDGYDYYGIFCQNGQVVGLRVTKYWGVSKSSDFSAAVGLVNLVNFTDVSGVGMDLLSVLAQSVPLRNVDTVSRSLVNFSWPDMLESLSGLVPSAMNFPLTNMTNLKRLKLLGPLADLSPLCNSSLIEIDLTFFNDSQLVELVNCLPSLEKVKFSTSRSASSDSDPLQLISPSLTYLSLSSLVESLVIDCPSLEYLEVTYNPTLKANVTAPNLKHFIFRGALPASFNSFTQLETFKWVSSNGVVPSLSFAPNLKSFSLESSNVLNTNLTELWQSIPSTIQTVSLEHVSFTAFMDVISFPTHWTSLTSLTIRNPYATQNLYNVSSILELRTLKALQYFGQTSFGDLKLLYALTNLEKLIFGLKSSAVIPPDFFRRMPQLTDVTFDSMFFTGPIPWYGWENLEYANFYGYFTSWPALAGTASQLKYLRLHAPVLSLLPTEADFLAANMTNLVSLSMPVAGAPSALPTFWETLPKLRHVEFKGSRFRGPAPLSIQAPMLKTMTISTTSLCGPLPHLSIPVYLESLDLSTNKFSGTIPASWEENLLARYFTLAYNPVNGTVPANLFTQPRFPSDSIDLENTFLSGSLWNMSSGAPGTLDIRNTLLDICAADPEYIGESNVAYCAFTNIPNCPDRCPSFWNLCRPFYTPCTESIVVIPTLEACTAVNESCPLPRPGEGFQCNRGVWILLQDLLSGSITLPPSAGSVIVYGNLANNDTIVFSGTGTIIQVEGCVENIEKIVLEIPSNETSGNVTLLTQLGSNCTKDLGKIPVQLVASEIECKSLQVSNLDSKATLNIVFSYQDSCPNTPQASTNRWIILGGSVGGVVLVFALSFAILYWRSPGLRAFVRTCSARRALTAK